jgi:hypothetical protein
MRAKFGIQRRWTNQLMDIVTYSVKGSSINDFTVLGGGGQGFCDKSTKALVIENFTRGRGGVEKCSKLRDVRYGRPLIRKREKFNLINGYSLCFSYFIATEPAAAKNTSCFKSGLSEPILINKILLTKFIQITDTHCTYQCE